MTVGQGPIGLVVGAGGGCLDIFTLFYHFLSSFSLSLGDGPILPLFGRRPDIVGWLVGCFGFNGPLRQYFSLYQAVSQREGDRERKG